MGDVPEPNDKAKQRLSKEYEDPHFHDDDEVAPVEEDIHQTPRRPPNSRRKLLRRPPRRFDED
jgi:hypothetical protein